MREMLSIIREVTQVPKSTMGMLGILRQSEIPYLLEIYKLKQ